MIPGATPCPLPRGRYDTIVMAHGGGGLLTGRLVRDLFLAAFDNPELARLHDGAILDPGPGGARLAFTTDAYVVRPLFFPGGDIGTLAVNGTANDLAMCGATPRWLSASFILEEGLPIADLARIAASMREAARANGMEIVAGDTKVVDRGKGDGAYLSTAGVGILHPAARIGPASAREGDAILVSGDIGRHGIAILSVREGLAFEGPVESDCAPLAPAALALLDAGIEVRCLRDLTRGGLAAALCELAAASGARFDLDETAIPVSAPVRAACEILGLDPLHVANEGRFAAIVPRAAAEAALDILRRHAPGGGSAAVVGAVRSRGNAPGGFVTARGGIGAERVIDLPAGEQLPRIC